MHTLCILPQHECTLQAKNEYRLEHNIHYLKANWIFIGVMFINGNRQYVLTTYYLQLHQCYTYFSNTQKVSAHLFQFNVYCSSAWRLVSQDPITLE